MGKMMNIDSTELTNQCDIVAVSENMLADV